AEQDVAASVALEIVATGVGVVVVPDAIVTVTAERQVLALAEAFQTVVASDSVEAIVAVGAVEDVDARAARIPVVDLRHLMRTHLSAEVDPELPGLEVCDGDPLSAFRGRDDQVLLAWRGVDERVDEPAVV